MRDKLASVGTWLLVAAVLSLSVPFLYLFPSETRLLGFHMGTVQNLGLLMTAGLAAITLGVRRWLNPVLGANIVLLLIGFTLSTRLPELSVTQSIRTFLALSLGAVIFELRLSREAWRTLLAALPWFAVINLGVGTILQLTSQSQAYRMDWGAFRLSGAVVPSHLASLGLAALIFALLQAREKKKATLLVVVNFAIVVWTGTRTAMGEATILIGAWLISEMIIAAKSGQRVWTPWRIGVLAAVPLLLLSYSPFMGKRLSSFHSHVAEGLEIQLPFLDGSDDEVAQDSGETPEESGRKKQLVRTYEKDSNAPSSGTLKVSTTGRLRAWKFFWEISRENPWFGRGLGAGVIAARGELPSAFEVPHNEYLRLVVDVGYLGLGVFVLGYLVQWLGTIRRLGASAAVILPLAVLAVMAIDGGLRNPLTAQHFMVPLWLFLATIRERIERQPIEFTAR